MLSDTRSGRPRRLEAQCARIRAFALDVRLPTALQVLQVCHTAIHKLILSEKAGGSAAKPPDLEHDLESRDRHQSK